MTVTQKFKTSDGLKKWTSDLESVLKNTSIKKRSFCGMHTKVQLYLTKISPNII